MSWNALALAHYVWLHHLACFNGLALHLTQYNGQGLDHSGWHANINYHAEMQ
jgi:hypothetical protein